MGGRTCPTCRGYGRVEKLGLFGFKIVVCKTCDGRGTMGEATTEPP